MGRFEQTISPSPPGAGRFRDYIWPDPASYQNGDFPSSRISSIVGTVGQLAAGNAVFGAGGGLRTNVRHQSPCIDLPCSAVVGNGNGRFFPSSRLFFPTARAANFSSGLANDWQSWRIVWIGGLVNAPGTEVDISCAVVPTANGADTAHIIAAARDGFGFGFQADGSVRFFSNVGGVVTAQAITPTAAQGYVIDAMHAYEMRMTGATATTDATLSCLVDGIGVALPAGLSTWGAGSNLPQQASLDTVSAGFMFGCGNVGNGVANTMFVNQVHIMCGPTPESCL